MEAGLTAIVARELKQPVNPLTLQLYGLLNAYAKNDAAAFNSELSEIRRTFAQHEQLLVDNRDKLEAASVKHSEIYGQSRVNFVLLCGGALSCCICFGGRVVAWLVEAATSGVDLAAVLYSGCAHVRAMGTDAHLRAAAGDEPVFVGDLHRLGMRRAWPDP
jgi:hypothetical protein